MIKYSTKKESQRALKLVKLLQNLFVSELKSVGLVYNTDIELEKLDWLRNEGVNGGGERFSSKEECTFFNNASINISQVHYNKNKYLSCATALSAIIHPINPCLPSIHIHISLTELNNNKHYWRIMADLNPSLSRLNESYNVFDEVSQISLGKYYSEAKQNGDKYFFIPGLNRHRGLFHYYLEQFKVDDIDFEFDFANQYGNNIIKCYTALLKDLNGSTLCKLEKNDLVDQINYHTLYFLQVLTLDRGTTSGLLIHKQNDIGILGSLPKKINISLLKEWLPKIDPLHQKLLNKLLSCLPIAETCIISREIKIKLADSIREFYLDHPEAITTQASGKILPETVQNHK